MAIIDNLNLERGRKSQSKRQIYQEEVKEMTKIPKRKWNFDKVFPYNKKGFDMSLHEKSMFEEEFF